MDFAPKSCGHLSGQRLGKEWLGSENVMLTSAMVPRAMDETVMMELIVVPSLIRAVLSVVKVKGARILGYDGKVESKSACDNLGRTLRIGP
jgi:hypothetical protein